MTTVQQVPTRHRRHHQHDAAPAGTAWTGRVREYDLVKELAAALLVVGLLTVGLASLFSSPDEPQLTLASWSRTAPQDFLATAATELDGTSGTATYGAPYNRTPHAAQQLGPVSLQHLAGVTQPVDTAADLVVHPLAALAGTDVLLTRALQRWGLASSTQRRSWAAAYRGPHPAAPVADSGPVPVMLDRLLTLARSGGLDGALLLQGGFFTSDYTRPLLFLADGTYLADRGGAQHLAGDQWGMMNETGSYPGQAWLWLYTFWYQVPPFSTSGNADALVMAVMVVLSLGLVCIPFLPGLRSVPRWIPVHRLIWRSYYRSPGTP